MTKTIQSQINKGLKEMNENVNVKVYAKTNFIANHVNPMEENVWSVGSFSADHVRAADNKYIETHLGHMDYATVDWDLANTKEYNIARIAWLMSRPDFDENDNSPITFYFYMFEGKSYFEIADGNHRLSAALVRGDETIPILLEINPRDSNNLSLHAYISDVLGIALMAVI